MRNFNLPGNQPFRARFKASGLDGWMDVCAQIQDGLVTAATGWPSSSAQHARWLRFLREAHLLFPAVSEFTALRIQVKFNRRGEGLPPGAFGDVALVAEATAEPTMLSAVIATGPTVVIAGSVT